MMAHIKKDCQLTFYKKNIYKYHVFIDNLSKTLAMPEAYYVCSIVFHCVPLYSSLTQLIVKHL